jgi:hypothetical protein
VNFAEKLQKNKIFLGAVIFLLCLGLVFAVQPVTNAGADPANNGNELGTLAPAETGLIIGGEGITRGLGFQQNFYYLSKAELNAMKVDAGNDMGQGDNDWFCGYAQGGHHGDDDQIVKRKPVKKFLP